MKRVSQRIPHVTLPGLIILLIVLGWYFVFQQSETLTQATITAYQQTQLEIVRAMARSVESYVADQVDLHGRQDIAQIEQELFQQFVDPVQLLEHGDAWIYAPDHVVFDRSSDFPDEYRGKSMAEIFALQQQAGASHYDEMTTAVMNAHEGVGWYIWLPDKGKEIAAWTPITVDGYVWIIGLSTPLPEILQSTGVTAQIRNAIVLMAAASLLSIGLLMAWVRSATRRGQAEQSLREAVVALEQSKMYLEEQVVARTAELIKTNSELQEEIAERKRTEAALTRAKEAAEVANRAKSTFLANMSHELRTPLTAILGYTDLIRLDAKRSGYADLLLDIDQIANAGTHLLTLINDLLDISKIEAGKMELYLERFELAPMIDSLVATIRPLVEKNGNTLHVSYSDNLGTLYADQTKVRQVLLNLLSNAAKFTEHGTIWLEVTRATVYDQQQPTTNNGVRIGSVTSEARPASFAIFKVRDTGIGMTVDQMQHIFEVFRQVASPENQKYGGTGLGLAISRHFCEMMGGTITVESEPGCGSTFTFHLPVQVAEQEVSAVTP